MAEFLGSAYNTIITALVHYKFQKTENSNTSVETGTESVTLGAVQSFAYRVNRTKAPIYVIGKKLPVTIARGARTFSGYMEGVVLSKNMYFYMAQVLLSKDMNNGKLNRVNLDFYINNVLNMTVSEFEQNVIKPILSAAGVTTEGSEAVLYSDKSTTVTTPYNSFTIGANTSEIIGKLPPLSIDDLPPIDIKLVTPLQLDNNNKKVIVEVIDLRGVEFMNSGIQILAGAEAIAESVSFIAKLAIRRIEERDI